MEASKSGPLAWLLYNGSVLVHGISEKMMNFGHATKMVEYLTWTVLALESEVVLCSPKYLPWRLQFYATLCRCVDRSSEFSKALRCANRALQQINNLQRWESMATVPPVPNETTFAINQGREAMKTLIFKYKYLLGEIPEKEVCYIW